MKYLPVFTLLFTLPMWPASVCISSPTANIRAAPNAGARILWSAPQHSPFIFVRQQGAWFEVQDMDNQKGWVSSGQVTQRYKCGAIKNNLVMGYLEPSTAKPRKDYVRLDRYWPLKRLDRKDTWLKVEDLGGQKYWVREEDVWLPMKEVSLDF